MPSGRTHDKINIILLFVILFSLFSLLKRPELPFPANYLESKRVMVFSLTYLFGTFFLSPDLDTRSAPFYRWGMLKVIWLPYHYLGHRGVLHHPLLGPLFLTFTPAVLLYFLFSLLNVHVESIPAWVWTASIFGIFLSIEAHCLSDMLLGKILRQ